MTSVNADASRLPSRQEPVHIGSFIRSPAFSATTDPPYWMRTLEAASSPPTLATRLRMKTHACSASIALAAFPVPMAQSGSYAKTDDPPSRRAVHSGPTAPALPGCSRCDCVPVAPRSPPHRGLASSRGGRPPAGSRPRWHRPCREGAPLRMSHDHVVGAQSSEHVRAHFPGAGPSVLIGAVLSAQ